MTFEKRNDVQFITELHTFCRAEDSQGEAEFIRRYIDTLDGIRADAYGNRHLTIGESKILFSCHTDTVHSPKCKSRQTVTATTQSSEVILSLGKNPKGHCLGADDGAGVWIMLEMIRAGVDGNYVFHRAEESGGKGSSFIANHTPHALDHIEFAIAFDRKGTDSIITNQMGRTASDKFANLFADVIGMEHSADPTGMFTDTANYTDLVSECTNVSVGYEDAHSSKETLNVSYLIELRDALIKADWTRLQAYRDPSVIEYDPWRHDTWTNDPNDPIGSDASLESLVAYYPEVAACVLETYGINRDEFEAAVDEFYGYGSSAYNI